MYRTVHNRKELTEVLQNKQRCTIKIRLMTESFPELEKAEHLIVVDVSFNRLIELPKLDALINLIKLDVEQNKLTALPSMNKLVNIKELYASYNKLTSLPDLNYSIVNLRHFFIDQNKLISLPEKLKTIFKYTYDNKYPKWLDYNALVK